MQQQSEQYITQDSTPHNGRTRTRSRRRIGRTRSKKIESDSLKQLRALVEYMATVFRFPNGTSEKKRFVSQELARLRAGIFDVRFWKESTLISKNYFSYSPQSTPDNNPPAYAYRTPANLPTIPIYDYGAPDIGPARYEGSMSSGYFFDSILCWERYIFDLDTKDDDYRYQPLVFSHEGILQITANMRGSRPMLSCILRSWIVSSDAPELSTMQCPAADIPPSSPVWERGMNSIYFRYRLPPVPAPYWNLTYARHMSIVLNSRTTYDPSAQPSKAVILLAPRPMFGRGFNNNTLINTTLTGAARLMILNMPTSFYAFAGARPQPQRAFKPNDPEVHYLDVDETITDHNLSGRIKLTITNKVKIREEGIYNKYTSSASLTFLDQKLKLAEGTTLRNGYLAQYKSIGWYITNITYYADDKSFKLVKVEVYNSNFLNSIADFTVTEYFLFENGSKEIISHVNYMQEILPGGWNAMLYYTIDSTFDLPAQ